MLRKEDTQRRVSPTLGRDGLSAGDARVSKDKMKLTRLEMAGVIPAEGPVGTNVVEKGIKTPAKTRTLS